MSANPKDGKLHLRAVRFLPENVETEPSYPVDIKIDPNIITTLSQLFGQTRDGGRTIDAFLWNALKVSCYGSGFQQYETISGTAPSSFASTHELSALSGQYHRFDILIESQEAEIRFRMDSIGSWGDAVPLPVGYHSMEFSSSVVQIRKRGATAGTYHITGYQ